MPSGVLMNAVEKTVIKYKNGIGFKIFLRSMTLEDAYKEVEEFCKENNLEFTRKTEKFDDFDSLKYVMQNLGIPNIETEEVFYITFPTGIMAVKTRQILDGIRFKTFEPCLVKCLVCDDPVIVTDSLDCGDMYLDAGHVEVSFGFGSDYEQYDLDGGGYGNFNLKPDNEEERFKNLLQCHKIMAPICDMCFRDKYKYFRGYYIKKTRDVVKRIM